VEGVPPSLDVATEALRSGEWHAACDLYRAALGDGVTGGEVHFGLGVAQWWLGETREALRCWERAYVAFEADGDHAQAVLAAFYLCLSIRMSLGNDAAANGWLERASTLAAEHDVGPLAGWVSLARAYTATDDGHPLLAAEHARQALDTADVMSDADLALCARCELGAALLAVGERDRAVALLDQAMAAALAGQAGDLDTVVLVACRTITACSRAAEVKRAAQWIRAADDFHDRYGSTHLYTTCRTHHGVILFAAGDWRRAEQELQAALRASAEGETALGAEAAAKLAELRVAQNRIEEAVRLLAGYEDHAVTTYARCLVHLARDESTAAASLARRRLRALDDRGFERAALVDVLASAGSCGGELLTAHDRKGVVGAYLVRARGRCEGLTAVRDLEDALVAFGELGLPYESARTRLLLAAAVAVSDRETAVAEASAALGAFDQLGAVRDADAAAALLRSLGAKAARSAPRGVDVLTRREREVLALLGEGLSNPAISERLYISRRTVEHHVASVLTKLGLSGRAEAAAYAIRHPVNE
jgi:DNA-binding CsgD family transcriptional regulator/predicted negative regulator of RcsB-dependent stress response